MSVQDQKPRDRITPDDLARRAEQVKELATSEVKAGVSRVVDQSATQTLVIMAGLVVVAASIAFYLGSRSRD